LDYKYDDFSIPEEVKQDFKVVSIRSKQAVKKYNDAVAKLSKSDKTLYTSFDSVAKQNFAFELSWFEQIPFVPKEATRTLFGQVFDIFFKHHPTFMAINPDISSSTKIKSGSIYGDTNQIGQTVNVGVREFIAADIVNGLTAHGGIRAASSTFLSFSDYNKQAIRLGAISNLPILNVFSHDTITVGEDGPTHQPIEQIPSLRLIPNHYLFRPCNTEECIATLKFLNSKNKPTTAITSRSAFTQIKSKVADALMGGYVVQDDKNYDLTIIATGSEIETAINVISELKKVNKNARLVSMPCVRLFKEQSSAYQQKVLGNKPIVSIEFAATAP
jgi:transketolase